MATQVAVPQEQMQHYNAAAEQFLSEVATRHPRLEINQAVIDAVVDELRQMGLFRQNISVKSFHAGFLSAVREGKIALPPAEPVLDDATIRKLAAKFPTVITKEKQLDQKTKSALAGIVKQTGRVNHAKEIAEVNAEIDSRYAGERAMRDHSRLRTEFKKALVDAQMIMVGDGRSHAKNASARKDAVAAVMNNPRFTSVRDST
jgi:hypothetical protein